jgi:hypothetical protein
VSSAPGMVAAPGEHFPRSQTGKESSWTSTFDYLTHTFSFGGIQGFW